MKTLKATLFLLLALVPAFAFTQEPSPLDAARQFRSDVKWKAKSVVTADIDCDGKKDVALLGTTDSEIVVVLFRAGLSAKPDMISVSATEFNAAAIKLATEPLNVRDADFQEMLGARPEGYARSATCKGLKLDDGAVDAIHLYWIKRRNAFGSWSM